GELGPPAEEAAIPEAAFALKTGLQAVELIARAEAFLLDNPQSAAGGDRHRQVFRDVDAFTQIQMTIAPEEIDPVIRTATPFVAEVGFRAPELRIGLNGHGAGRENLCVARAQFGVEERPG